MSAGLFINFPLHARTAVFSPDGAYLAVSFFSHQEKFGRVEIWDTQSWQKITDIPLYASQKRREYSFHPITFSPDGKWFLIGRESPGGNPAQVIDVQTWQCTTRLDDFFTWKPCCGPLAFSSDGKLLATRVSYDDAMAIRDAKTWEKIFEVTANQITSWFTNNEDFAQFVKSIHFIPNQQRIVMLCNNKVLLWDIESLMKLINYLDTKLSYEEVVLLKDILHPHNGGVHILTEQEQKILDGLGDNDAQMKAIIHDGLSSYFQQSSCVIQ